MENIINSVQTADRGLGGRTDMQEIEKILEEMSRQLELSTSREYRRGWRACKDRMMHIVRKHMNDGWIPVEKALPPEPPEYVDDEDDLEQCIVMIDGA